MNKNILAKFEDVVYIDLLPEPGSAPESGYTKTLELNWQLIKGNTNFSNSSTKILPKKYTPTPKTKVFFYPNCSVPRFKVREWGKKHNIKITTKCSAADVTFASNKTVLSLVDTMWASYTNRLIFLQFLTINYSNHMYEGSAMQLLFEEVSNNTAEFVYLPYHYAHSRSWFFNPTHQSLTTINGLGGEVKTIYLKFASQDSYATIARIVSDPVLFPESEIIEFIHEDAAVLDKQMYNQLRVMFESTANADQVLALETITNCNYNQSLHYVLLLMKEYGNTVIHSLKERSHVNFKSLLKYIGRADSYNIKDDEVIQILMDKDALTKTVLAETAAAIKERWKKAYDSEHFKINTITVSDDVKAYFGIATSPKSNVEQIIKS